MQQATITTFLSWEFVRSYEEDGHRVEVRKDEEGREWKMAFTLPSTKGTDPAVRRLRGRRGVAFIGDPLA